MCKCLGTATATFVQSTIVNNTELTKLIVYQLLHLFIWGYQKILWLNI